MEICGTCLKPYNSQYWNWTKECLNCQVAEEDKEFIGSLLSLKKSGSPVLKMESNIAKDNLNKGVKRRMSTGKHSSYWNGKVILNK